MNPKLEIQFLDLAKTDLTYAEIGDKMGKMPRTIEGYRDILFKKYKQHTRHGLLLYAIRHEIIRL